MATANEPSHADKTLRGIRQIGTARVFTQVVTWGLTAVTIHILTPRDYGLIATAGIITTFAQMFIDAGLTDVLVGQRVLPERVQGAAVSASLIVSSLLGAMLFGIAPFAAEFFRSPPLRAIIEFTAFYFPLTSLEVVPGALLSKTMRFGRLATIQTLSGITQGLSTLGLAYLGEAYWALIFGNFIATGIRVGLLWTALERKPKPNFHVTALTPLFRSSSHLIGQRFTSFCVGNYDIFLLGRVGGPSVVGPYSVARNLAHAALNQISSVVNQVLLPAFAAKTGTPEQLRALVSVISFASTILFPLFWVLGAASPILFSILFGPKWHALVVPFLAFTAVLPLTGIYALISAPIIGTGRTGTTFTIALTRAVVMIPLISLGVTKGAPGVALSWTVGSPIVFYIAFRRIAAAFGTQPSALALPILKPALCAGASALVAAAVLLAPPGLVPRPALLGLQIIIAALCYGALLRTIAPFQYSQALSTARRLMRS